MKGFALALSLMGGLFSLARSADLTSARPGRALILIGLPGDPEHDARFRSTARAWKDQLVGPLGFEASGVRLLSGLAGEPGFSDAPATRESISRAVARLIEESPPEGRVWVFVLGHANLDEGHTYIHLPGPDLRDDEFAALFTGLEAQEQVFWMTTSASGAFLPALSRPGRVVVAATERSGEANETEFPHVLARVLQAPAVQVDRDRDGKVSVLELLLATIEGVEKEFEVSRRAPTEHAQFDDNGDGVGLEPKPGPKEVGSDGLLTSKIYLPKTSPKPSPRSDHGNVSPPR